MSVSNINLFVDQNRLFLFLVIVSCWIIKQIRHRQKISKSFLVAFSLSLSVLSVCCRSMKKSSESIVLPSLWWLHQKQIWKFFITVAERLMMSIFDVEASRVLCPSASCVLFASFSSPSSFFSFFSHFFEHSVVSSFSFSSLCCYRFEKSATLRHQAIYRRVSCLSPPIECGCVPETPEFFSYQPTLAYAWDRSCLLIYNDRDTPMVDYWFRRSYTCGCVILFTDTFYSVFFLFIQWLNVRQEWEKGRVRVFSSIPICFWFSLIPRISHRHTDWKTCSRNILFDLSSIFFCHNDRSSEREREREYQERGKVINDKSRIERWLKEDKARDWLTNEIHMVIASSFSFRLLDPHRMSNHLLLRWLFTNRMFLLIISDRSIFFDLFYFYRVISDSTHISISKLFSCAQSNILVSMLFVF